MNKIQALNILTGLANAAQAGGLLKDINEAGSVYTALLVLSQDLPQPEVAEPTVEEVPTQVPTQEPVVEPDGQPE